MSDIHPLMQMECPHCGASISSGQQDCPECGVDLLLYTDMLFRRRMEEALSTPPSSPSSIEELIPRLGARLVQQKVITQQQLKQALAFQKNAVAAGTPQRIGQILIQMGFITNEDLDRAVAHMVAELQSALQSANRGLEERVRLRTAELSRALERLSELNQLKANFVANISHELRTPLTHIVGYLDLLAEQTFGPLTPEQKDAVDTLRRAGQRLHDLIEDLIQYSDSSRGEISLSFHQVPLREVIQDAMSRLYAKAERADVSMEIRVPPDLPDVHADFRKLSWVISQLMDNGVKFTPAGGMVTLTAALVQNRVRISIQDTGIGIPESRLQELFQPFHQLDSSMTRKHSGTGLGLAMCKQIIEAHGFTISVQSKEGKGSLFQFDLHPKAGAAAV